MRQSIPRWGLFVIVALLALGLSSATQADGPVDQEKQKTQQSDDSSANGDGIPFQDVPANHWAADDVRYLVDQGVIEGVPGGEFQGERSPTRYEVATMLSRALQGLEKMQPQTASQTASSGQPIRKEDLQVLRDLIFKISDRVQALNGEVDKLKNENPEIDPQLRKRIQNVESQSDRISQLQSTVKKQRQQLNKLQKRMESFQVESTTATEKQLAKADQQILANRIIGITGLLFSVVGIALTTLR
ncbi:MAG: S-layer homology domain-containing protein [Candidatus Bipolaricaulia bacterium]